MDDDPDDFDFYYTEDDFDFVWDDTLDHVDDEPDNCAGNVSDEEEIEKDDPIELTNVRRAKERLGDASVFDKVKKVLACMPLRILARTAAEQ